MIHLILFFNLIVAVWVFYDSQKYGYSVSQGLLWAIGVFLILIVFLPLYLFNRNKRKRIAISLEKTQTPAALTPCFYCGKSYPGDPKICPNCGQNLKMQS